MTRFDEAVDWPESLQKFGIRPGLERMHHILEQLGNPQHRLKFVHIAGTNGKGSTVQYISSVLKEAGYTVGTFTSPSFMTLLDRIQCNGVDISEGDFINLVDQIKPVMAEMESSEWGPATEFEAVTVLAILYFATVAYPDIVIWETGLGGRLDSTNVVFPLVSAITNIGFDHTHILGDRLEQIAAEKAGIIKNGFPVVTTEQNPVSLEVLKTAAKQKKAPFYQLGREFSVERSTAHRDSWEEVFHFQGPFNEYQDLAISMAGEHQVRNAGLAVMVLDVLKQYYAFHFEKEHLLQGLRKANWPGRFEIMQKNPFLILDGAHNMDGIKVLIRTIHERFPGQKPRVLFSALADKDVKGMVERLAPECRQVIITKTDHLRAEEPSNMEMWFRDANPNVQAQVIPDWRAAVRHWYDEHIPGDILLAAGSLYFISDIKREFGRSEAFRSDFETKAGE